MKPTIAADEMFPEGVGPYMDLEEMRSSDGVDIPYVVCTSSDKCVCTPLYQWCTQGGCNREAERPSRQAGGSSGLLMDLAANEKAVHADFFNDFEDLFDDDDLL